MRDFYPLFIGNRPIKTERVLEVADKFTGGIVTRVSEGSAVDVDRAIAAAAEAVGPMRALAPFERRDILLHCAMRFSERRDELASAVCSEAGKTIRESRVEVSRLIATFEIAAGEAVRNGGEALNLEIGPRSRGYRGFTKRVSVGPCSFITPFNFPLNLVAHKVAPAIAAGCPFVLKPASLTPVSALLMGEILAETPLPPGAFSIIPCSRSAADALTTDERVALLSFTGSPVVGWDLKTRAGKKKTVLELGGNAACILDRGTNLNDAVPRLIAGAFGQAGQSCISVQRIIVHSDLAVSFEKKFLAAAKCLRTGDPSDDATDVGPMISADAANRLAAWVEDAISGGARLLLGGPPSGSLHSPTVLKFVPHSARLYEDEAFGPVVMIETFDDFEEALRIVNNSRFGIHAGVFTPSLSNALRAWDALEVGGVLINEVPTWRVDNLPYGGVKESGQGREGVRQAIDEMTEIRSLVIRG